MKQRTRRLAIVISASLLTTLGFIAACSTDNGSTPLPGSSGGVDSGRDSKGGGGDGSSVETDGDTTPEDDAAGGADCGLAPKLRTTDQGFFCAFFTRDAAAGDAGAGGNRNCANDEICCNPGPTTPGGNDFPASFCADKAAGTNECSQQAAANGTTWNQVRSSTWECADKSACGGQKCCMYTWADAGPMDKVNLGPLSTASVPKACNALMAYKAGGSRCAADCNADDIQLCSLTDDNCSGNQKCTPFSGNFRDLGACQ